MAILFISGQALKAPVVDISIGEAVGKSSIVYLKKNDLSFAYLAVADTGQKIAFEDIVSINSYCISVRPGHVSDAAEEECFRIVDIPVVNLKGEVIGPVSQARIGEDGHLETVEVERETLFSADASFLTFSENSLVYHCPQEEQKDNEENLQRIQELLTNISHQLSALTVISDVICQRNSLSDPNRTQTAGVGEADEQSAVSEIPHIAPEQPIVTEIPHEAPEQPIVTEIPHIAPEQPIVTEIPHIAPEQPTVTEIPHIAPEQPTVSEMPLDEPQIHEIQSPVKPVSEAFTEPVINKAVPSVSETAGFDRKISEEGSDASAMVCTFEEPEDYAVPKQQGAGSEITFLSSAAIPRAERPADTLPAADRDDTLQSVQAQLKSIMPEQAISHGQNTSPFHASVQAEDTVPVQPAPSVQDTVSVNIVNAVQNTVLVQGDVQVHNGASEQSITPLHINRPDMAVSETVVVADGFADRNEEVPSADGKKGFAESLKSTYPQVIAGLLFAVTCAILSGFDII